MRFCFGESPIAKVGVKSLPIGVGNGICGPSAIAAVTPFIGEIGIDVAFAIFLFSIASVLVFPIIGLQCATGLK